jgi:hypothetical protein
MWNFLSVTNRIGSGILETVQKYQNKFCLYTHNITSFLQHQNCNSRAYISFFKNNQLKNLPQIFSLDVIFWISQYPNFMLTKKKFGDISMH